MSRQNWSEECEVALNEQIRTEYRASLQYHVLAAYFYRDDIGLMKLGDFYNKRSKEEREHADELMRYQTMRGGVVKLITLPVEELTLLKEKCILQSFRIALEQERTVNQKLLELHAVASKNNDPQFSDYIEGTFLKEQVEDISFLSKSISTLEMYGHDFHGAWHFVESLV